VCGQTLEYLNPVEDRTLWIEVLSTDNLSAMTTFTRDKPFQPSYRDLRNMSSPSYMNFFSLVPFLNSAQEQFYFPSLLPSTFSFPHISFFFSSHTCSSSFFRILAVLPLETDKSKRSGENFKISVIKRKPSIEGAERGR
jgi:hypothetical protein